MVPATAGCSSRCQVFFIHVSIASFVAVFDIRPIGDHLATDETESASALSAYCEKYHAGVQAA